MHFLYFDVRGKEDARMDIRVLIAPRYANVILCMPPFMIDTGPLRVTAFRPNLLGRALFMLMLS